MNMRDYPSAWPALILVLLVAWLSPDRILTGVLITVVVLAAVAFEAWRGLRR